MKRFLIAGFVALLAAGAQAQTLGNPHYIAYPANTTTRLDDKIAAMDVTIAAKEAADVDLDCIAALATNGFVNRTGSGTCTAAALVATDIPALDWAKITTGKPTTLAGYGITDAQGLDCDLTSLAGASSVAIYYRSAACTWGAVTIGSGVAFSGGTLSATGTGGTVTSVGLSSSDFTVSGSPVTGSGSITANMNTQAGITPASYGDASHTVTETVNSKGVLTALSSNAIVLNWSAITTGKPTTAAGYGITGGASLDSLAGLTWTAGVQVPAFTAANTLALKTVGAATGNLLDKAAGDSLYLALAATAADSLKLGGVVAASYQLTSAKDAASGYAGLDASALLKCAEFPATSGDISNTAGSCTTTLATVNANTGAFGSATQAPVISLDAKGRVTAASNVIITPAFSSLTGSAACAQLPALTGDATTTAGTCATALAASGVTAAAYGDVSHTVTVTFDAKGRATAAASNIIAIAGSQITSGTVAAAQMPAFSGDATTVAGTTAITFATVNSNTGACGDSTHVGAVTLNGKGLATACTATAISASGIGAEQTANKGAASGYAGLDGSSKVAIANLPTGTTSTTVAIGNDTRITGAAQAANNLSDLGSFIASRNNISTTMVTYGLNTACATDANCTPVFTVSLSPFVVTTTKTANRKMNLAATNATTHQLWIVVNKSADAFGWQVFDNASSVLLKTLTANTWGAFAWDGASWQEVMFGAL